MLSLKNQNMQTEKKPAFTTIDEYIALQTKQAQPYLNKLRKIIQKAAPDAEEVISYQMPAFKFHGMLAWFAAWKNHYALYAMPSSIEKFKPQLEAYELSKGTIKFTYDKPIPAKLITEMIQYKAEQNLQKKALKEMAKRKK